MISREISRTKREALRQKNTHSTSFDLIFTGILRDSHDSDIPTFGLFLQILTWNVSRALRDLGRRDPKEAMLLQNDQPIHEIPPRPWKISGEIGPSSYGLDPVFI